MRENILALRRLLAERYRLDRELRETAARLPATAGRGDIDERNAERIKLAVSELTEANQNVVADTFERRQGIDTRQLLDLLDRIGGRKKLRFDSLAEAAAFTADLRAFGQELQNYSSFSSFSDWSFAEKSYFSGVRTILDDFEPLVVYVPD
jgi:hypothetical protein